MSCFRNSFHIEFVRPKWEFRSALSEPYNSKDEAYMSVVMFLRKVRKRIVKRHSVCIYEFMDTGSTLRHSYNLKAELIGTEKLQDTDVCLTARAGSPRVFVTGDVHRHWDISKVDRFSTLMQSVLSLEDYLIICGDFGGVWAGRDSDLEFLCKSYDALPCSVLFVDGNHENFEELYKYPVTEWKGGRVHEINSKIRHLMRGEVFDLTDGCKIFAFGGAKSTDRGYGTHKNCAWWSEELPTQAEYDNALRNLQFHNHTVDYIITHDCGRRVLRDLFKFLRDNSPELSGFFDAISGSVNFRHWYFGHHHVDKTKGKFTCLFDSIIEL